MLSVAHIARISGFTLFQAVCSTAVALAIGLAAAFFTARRQFFGRRFLLSLSSVPMCIPTLLIALGYIAVWGRAGVCNHLLQYCFDLAEPPLTFLYSLGGIIIAQGFYNFPLVMATVGDSWSRLPPEEAAAARLLGASEWRIFRTITLRQLASAIVSACIPVFLFCFFSFMIVLLFGGVGCTTLEVELYRAARSQPDFAHAAGIAVTETVTALAIVAAYSAATERKTKRGLQASVSIRLPLCGAGERVAFSLFSLCITVFFLAPLFGIVWNALTSSRGALTFATLAHVFNSKGFFPAIRGTLLTASATGTLCALIAFCYAALLRSYEGTPRAATKTARLVAFTLRTVPLLPMAISSVVLGVCLTALVRRGNTVLLIAAQTALFWPFAFRQLFAQLSKIPPQTLDAARLFAKHRYDTLLGLYLPCSARGLLSAAGFCFAISAGDTTLPLVLALPQFNTLSLFTYRLAGAYRFHEACAAGMLLATLCAVVFAVATAIKKEKSHEC